ncbi:hypothetical protein Q9L58_010401, partial [Maublancomyces gigas]
LRRLLGMMAEKPRVPRPPPPSFNLLKNQYAAEYPNAAQLVPVWTWPEFQVHADRYARVHKQEPHFHSRPDGSQVMMHAANRKKEGCDRLAYPRAGPLGTPIAIIDRNERWGGPQPANPSFPIVLPAPAPSLNFAPGGTQALTDMEDQIPIGTEDTNKEMVEATNEAGLTDETPALNEEDDFSSAPIPTTPTPSRPSSPAPTPSLPFHKDYLKDIFPAIAPEVQYLVWHMRENRTLLTQNINMAHEQINGLQKAIHAQAAAITKLTATVQLLRTNPPPSNNTSTPLPSKKGKGK